MTKVLLLDNDIHPLLQVTADIMQDVYGLDVKIITDLSHLVPTLQWEIFDVLLTESMLRSWNIPNNEKIRYHIDKWIHCEDYILEKADEIQPKMKIIFYTSKKTLEVLKTKEYTYINKPECCSKIVEQINEIC